MASALLLGCLLAADVTGIWVGSMERQNAEPLDIAVRLVQKGQTVTGKLYDDYKSPPVTEGKFDGESLSFTVVVAEQAGNEIRHSRYRYTGRLAGGELEMSREREASINAANGGGVQPPRNATQQTFRLKRLPSKPQK